MAYRSDLDALQARHVALEAEVADKTRARDEVARMLADARAIEEAARELTEGPARRRRRWRLAAAAATALVLVAGAVGYRLVQPRRDQTEEVIRQMSRFTDEVCGCTDTACVRQVSDAMAKWGMALAKEQPSPPKPDEAMMKRLTEITTRMSSCMMRAMSVETATVTP
jgi:hypothetical protein